MAIFTPQLHRPPIATTIGGIEWEFNTRDAIEFIASTIPNAFCVRWDKLLRQRIPPDLFGRYQPATGSGAVQGTAQQARKTAAFSKESKTHVLSDFHTAPWYKNFFALDSTIFSQGRGAFNQG